MSTPDDALRRIIEHGPIRLPVASPEDTILAKRLWYRRGGEVSDRQWSDIRGIVEVQKGHLDLDYLRRWARDLGVEDLLERILSPLGR